MSREEILKQIEDIEEREFFLQMKDRWSQEDYRLSDKHHEEIRELKKKLEELWVPLFFECVDLDVLRLIQHLTSEGKSGNIVLKKRKERNYKNDK